MVLKNAEEIEETKKVQKKTVTRIVKELPMQPVRTMETDTEIIQFLTMEEAMEQILYPEQ